MTKFWQILVIERNDNIPVIIRFTFSRLGNGGLDI